MRVGGNWACLRIVCFQNDLGRDTHGGNMSGDVAKDNGVGTYFRVVTDDNTPKDFCAGPDIDVSAEFRRSGLRATCTQRHLLEQQTIGADLCRGVNHDTIGVSQE